MPEPEHPNVLRGGEARPPLNDESRRIFNSHVSFRPDNKPLPGVSFNYCDVDPVSDTSHVPARDKLPHYLKPIDQSHVTSD